MRWDPGPRRPFDAIKKHAFLAAPAGNQVIHLSVFDGQKTTAASLAGKQVMPSSAFAKAWRYENEASRSFGKTKGATPPRQRAYVHLNPVWYGIHAPRKVRGLSRGQSRTPGIKRPKQAERQALVLWRAPVVSDGQYWVVRVQLDRWWVGSCIRR